MRLNKFLSKANIASRREADRHILDGRVTVNGEVVKILGRIVDESKDEVLFDGKPVRIADRYIYMLLNKPSGYLVTCRDDFDRPKVIDLLGKYRRMVRPVGRLDRDSSGLLLLTNDGDLAFRLTHPRYKIDKKYLVKYEGFLEDDSIGRLSRGILLDDGKTWPAELELISRSSGISRFFITIREGRKRQIRRMCKAVGGNVLSLKRVKFGGIELGDLKSGGCRHLTEKEVMELRASVGYEKP
jgi:pseudouridine synthase